MKSIRFDFNNLFSHAVGRTHGVDVTQLRAFKPKLTRARRHLEELCAHPANRVRLGLEWTKLPYQSADTIASITGVAEQVCRRYDNVLFLGIGGSYLGLKAAQDALCPPYYNEFPALRRGRPRIYFEGNNLDPVTLQSLLSGLDPRRTYVVVISKSGETTETKAAFMRVEAWLKKALGKAYGRSIMAITDPETGSLRRKVERAQRKDPRAFMNFPLLKGVGGRFSELNMGLFHLAVAGINIRDVLKGAGAMARRIQRSAPLKDPALLYAALHVLLYRNKGKAISVLMPFCETLRSTADWYVQLLAESLGKKYGRRIEVDAGGNEHWHPDRRRRLNAGRTPVASRGTNDLHSIEGEYDKVVTFIRVEKFVPELRLPPGPELISGRRYSELMQLAQEATEWALVEESRPNCTIILPEVSPYYWGALLYFFEMATAYEGELLNVNAFDQPGVEGYKNYMYYKLGKTGLAKDIVSRIRKNPLKKKGAFVF